MYMLSYFLDPAAGLGTEAVPVVCAVSALSALAGLVVTLSCLPADIEAYGLSNERRDIRNPPPLSAGRPCSAEIREWSADTMPPLPRVAAADEDAPLTAVTSITSMP